MRIGWIIVITALVSALFSVGLYRVLEQPKEVVIRETAAAK